MIAALKNGAALRMGSRHPYYEQTTEADSASRESLLADLG